MENRKRKILKRLSKTCQIAKSEFDKEIEALNKSTESNKKEAFINLSQNYNLYLLKKNFII